ncbi:LytTR family DNA-binding domain-containing protein [Culicoidibacter larvae]|uniref:LytTR family transcriptional regulator n=1 Tax=Culicoidibacter larvae TaxID=2579976 RepID=A0A5R8Q985_9FIRM|nr:LytTR family DNA-binding domain-containing protein [Culicoidibacter larvae]TLG72470.1 LytTR family transcriptional regulator [Culicoidibacter larvae]
MKVSIVEDANIDELSVVIKTPKVDDVTTSLHRMIEGFSLILICDDNGMQCRVAITDILYCESVDKRTFVYTNDKNYETKLPLYQIEQQFGQYGLTRISKAMVVNLNNVLKIKPLFSARALLYLCNDETVEVSRQYFRSLKNKLSLGGKKR